MASRKNVAVSQWGRTTKIIVVLVCLVLVAVLAWQYSGLIGQFVVAAMLAYIVNPAIEWIQAHSRFSRGWAVMIVYLALIVIGLGFMTLIGVAVTNQGRSLLEQFPDLVKDVAGYFDQMRASTGTITIGPLNFPLAQFTLDDLEAQAAEIVKPLVPQGVSGGVQAIGISFGVFGWLSVTLLLSIYVAIDMPGMGIALTRLADQSGYRDDYHRLVRGFNRIWDAYLRGQVILGVIIAIITSVMLAALGVENWLALGLLSGVLQVIPYVGPTVSAIFIVMFALFQPGNYLGLAPGIYALVVGVVTLVVQQVSGNILLPTVVGDALSMSPLAVLVSLIFGFAVAGVMGVILAAPVIASLRLLATYIWRKLLDLPPFPEEEPPPTQVTLIVQRSKKLIEQIRNRREPADPSADASSEQPG